MQVTVIVYLVASTKDNLIPLWFCLNIVREKLIVLRGSAQFSTNGKLSTAGSNQTISFIERVPI